MLNYRWLQKAFVRATYSSVPASYAHSPTKQVCKSSHPSHTSTHLHTPYALSGPRHISHVPPPPPVLRALPHSLLSAPFCPVFCRLSQSACFSFLHQTPLPSTCAHKLFSSLDAPLCHLCIPSSPQFPYSQPRNKFQSNRFTFLGKMSRGGRGHSGSTTGNVKVPQLLPSSAAPARTLTAL